ncbi:MAG: hypothetical protein MI975_20895 [Cytophagales bacterium]|nr:hypothetical protein [Cytophagales bacterium]
MEKNIDLLTQKIYEEGIEKANQEVEKIIDEARQKADSIVKKAKGEAERIIENAGKEADALQKNSISEIKLGGQQAISSLKQNIQNLLSDKILSESISMAFEDPEFLKGIILEVVKEWRSASGTNISLSEGLKEKIDKSFEKSLSKEIKNLNITFDKKLKGGFKVSQSGKTFQIVFSDEDFIEFFKPYLRERSKDILFN